MKLLPLSRGLVLLATFVLCSQGVSRSATLIARNGAGWKYLKGTAEASNPTGAWRAQGFDAAAWSTGGTPFRYGDGSGGTQLDDMRGSYTTVFLRRTFNVNDVALISRLEMNIDYDDGFTVWINGTEVLSQNAPANPSFNSFAATNHESGAFETFEIANPAAVLVDGENTIAIQVFNVSLTSSDLMMNPELVSTAPDFEPPAVLSFDPAPGTVLDLSQITVTFTEPVTGVEARDLEINDTAAGAVTGSGDQYTFTFAAVPLGQATVTWAPDHGIADTAAAPNPFDSTVPGEVRIYNVVDNLPPEVAGIFPPAGVTLRGFGEVEVTFTEAVSGIDAADLLAGGIAAGSVAGSGAGPYVFSFGGVGDGALAMEWAAGHGIEDFAAEPNAFVANSWSYTIDPDAAFGDLVINEFVASNRGGLLDADGEASDWVELYNFGATAVELSGWSLSDDPAEPGKFVLPPRTLPAGGYLMVFASGKDRAPAGGGEIHTGFKLSGSGEYLGLFTPESPRQVADELAPAYPQQRTDFSYGRDSAGTWRYYSPPTPGGPNGDSAIAGLLDAPHFNVERGFYDRPFQLHLTNPEAGATIRYTTDGSEPTENTGQIYSGPITINSTTALRAAAFKAGFLPSEPATHTYLYNASAAIRSLPVVSLVTDNSNLWGPTGIQEINPRNCAQRGLAWERPVSAEVLNAGDAGRNTGVNCGLRVQGGNYVRGNYNPNGSLPFSKYSFRLYFRGDYGPTMWDYPFFPGHAVQEFDRITLRAGMNDHSNPFIVDELIRRLQFDTGQVAARGSFVNLFINGQHKGYYNPTERIDDDFMRSWHGGDEAWDVIAQFGEVREGDAAEWNSMRTIVGRDQSVPANYAASLGVVDIDNFIDYLLVNIYGGTGDWPHNNWRAARQRTAGSKFRFYVWDAEWSLGNLGRSVGGNTLSGELGGGSEIAVMYQSLTGSPEFRLRFADRVHKHFYNGGALEDAEISAHYEAARAAMSGVLPSLSTSIRDTWIPQRRGIIMGHLADADLQHSADAPTFGQFGGPVTEGYALAMAAPNGGTIYYTLDGTDPREPPSDDGGAGGPTEILAEGAAKRVLVPVDGSLGTAWTGGAEPFDDSSWIAGSGGVGYDEAATYDPLISIDVDAQMNDINTSCYIRIPFTVAAGDLDGANVMQLKARFDDGFIAYLNGVRITAGNGPASPVWNSTSSGDNPDTAAVNPRAFNVTDFMGELVIGNNLLAIHGLNVGLTSSDFLASFSLEVGENVAGEVSDTAIEYTAPVAIAGTTAVKSRTLRNGVWSAATEATFYSGPAAPQIRITEIMYHPPGGSAWEYIEIQNVGPLPADLSFMQFDGVNFAFPGETVLAPGAILLLVSNDDPDGFAANWPGIPVFGYFGGSLSNGGERVALLDAFGNTLVSVDYSDGDGWPAEADGGGASLALLDPAGDPDDPANWTGGGSPGNGNLRPLLRSGFSEVRAAGAPGEADFVELTNHSLFGTLDLGGYGFSDDPGNPMRFTFPAGTQLAVGEYLVVWCDSEPGLHSGFGLDREGETLFLTDLAGKRVDAFSFGLQAPGYSLSRASVTQGSQWLATVATPGAAIGAPVSLAPQSQLSINEWLANPLPGGDDWLELYNRDATDPIALQGLHISSGGATFRIGALSFLEPGGFLRLWADGGVGPDHLDLRLPAAGGTLALVDLAGAEVESVTYAGQSEGVARGRLPDGAANITNFPTSASPGAPNYAAATSPMVFNELLAGGAGWIELKNTAGTAMLLDGFSVAVDDRDAPRVPLPNGLSVPAGGRAQLALATSPAGGAVFLFDPAGREVGRVVFGAQPAGLSIGRPADSGGFTLLISPTPAAANAGAAPLGSTTGLRINEWLADADPGADDFVELYNPGANPVSLAGLRLTDDLSVTGIDQFAFPPLSYIGGGGFVALTADNTRQPGHLPFNLDADGETLRLHAAAGTTIIDELTWGIETEGISSGRTTDGGATIAQLAFQSPGLSNETDPNADRDGDGIPDLWEEANGLDPDDPDDAALDLDGDTRSALFEYLSGTDPNDPASLLRFESMTLDLTGFTLQFTARAGIRYTVQFTDDLADGGWATIETVEPSATDHTETVFDIGGGSERFYRIIAERS